MALSDSDFFSCLLTCMVWLYNQENNQVTYKGMRFSVASNLVNLGLFVCPKTPLNQRCQRGG